MPSQVVKSDREKIHEAQNAARVAAETKKTKKNKTTKES